MAVSSVSVSSTDTVNTVTVTDTSNISVVTVGEQGLGGPSTVLGRGVASLTAGSSDDKSSYTSAITTGKAYIAAN